MKGSTKLKQRLTVAFLLMQLRKRSTNPLSSGRVNSHSALRNFRIHFAKLMFTVFFFFFNSKSWVTSQVMEAVLARFNRNLVFEDRKVILFLDYATCHPEFLIAQFLHIKLFSYRRIQLWGYNHSLLTTSKISRSSTEKGWLSMCL